jgi:hypothetical protein
MRVFAGVPIWRAVAAKRGSTCLAGAQMNPICADLYAFFAFTALRLLDRIDRVEMRTASVGHDIILAAPVNLTSPATHHCLNNSCGEELMFVLHVLRRKLISFPYAGP